MSNRKPKDKPPLGPVLFYDDDKKWAKTAHQILLRRKIEVDVVVDDFEKCLNLLSEKMYLVFVLNVHALSDAKTILARLASDFPSTDILIYGNREDPDLIKYLWPPEQLAGSCFGNKHVNEVSELGRMVEKVIETQRRIPGQIQIEFDDDVDDILDAFSKARVITRSGLRRERLETSLKRMKDELRIIVGKLFIDPSRNMVIAKKVRIGIFSKSGKSSSCLLKITPDILLDNKKRISAVLKFGPKEDIDKEAYNYDFFVQWFLTKNQTVHKIGYAEANKYSAILYSYPSDNPDITTSFAEYIRQNTSENILKILDKMFNIENQHWLSVDGNSRVPVDYAVFQTYYIQNVLHASIFEMRDADDGHFKKFLQECDKLQWKREEKNKIIIATKNQITFPDLSLTIPNPMYFLSNCIVEDVKLAVIHGDLHGHNILIDTNDDKYFFIDFFYTGYGDIFRDFIELEISSRYDLFCSSALDDEKILTGRDSKTTNTNGLKKLLRLEKGLIMTSVLGEEIKDPIFENDEDIKKGFEIITAIRKYAFENYEKRFGKESLTKNIHMYYLGLAMSSLKGLKYFFPIDVKIYRLIIAGLYIEVWENGHFDDQ